MTVKLYYGKDEDTNVLHGKTIAVIGYGSEGHAQAQNMRDSGFKVIIGLRAGKSAEKAKGEAFEVMSVGEAVKLADVVQILMPDETQSSVFREEIEPNLRQGAALIFPHSFNVHFGQIKARKDNDVLLVAPNSPSHMVRRTYVEGFDVFGPNFHGLLSE